MKKLLLILIVFGAFSCKKDTAIVPATATINAESKTVNTSTEAATIATPNLAATNITGAYVDVKTQGAKGDGVTDDTQAITNALLYAKSRNIPNIYFPDGTYMIGALGHGGGIIKLYNGVGMMGNSAATCHIKLTGGRYNPNPIFYQDYMGYPSIGNLVIQGIDFDGNLANQKFDSEYQYCHAFKFHSGNNIEVKNCKFQNFRGDGVLFGDTFTPSLNIRIVRDASVHDNEFFNIYREGAMFCSVDGAKFYNNYVHGNGYLVGGVDIERHSVNESVLNVSVYNNTFNFTDGYGPIERGGPQAKYRRAVTIGFFYEGYTNAICDSLSGHHLIYNNKIYQGQIDCWGVANVSISGNTITNTYENITGIHFLTAPAINVSDPGNTKGLIKASVDNNIINSAIGNGILFNNYSQAQANANIITGTPADGINLISTNGWFYGNSISDAGTKGKPAAGFVISGNSTALTIINNQVSSTKTGLSRTTDYVVKIVGYNTGNAPKVINNKATNLLNGIILLFYAQPNLAELVNNLFS